MSSSPGDGPAPAGGLSSSSKPAASMAAPTIPNLLARLGSGPPRAGRGGRRGFGPGRGRDGAHHQQPQPPYPPHFPSTSASPFPPSFSQARHPPSYGVGRGGGRSSSGGSTAVTLDHDGVIQSTDTDAAISRLSVVDTGLLDDPFAQFFAGDGGPAPRRLPIINRGAYIQVAKLYLPVCRRCLTRGFAGTYTRTQALDRLIRAFLSGGASPGGQEPPFRQVVSLGAGTDTRSLRFLARQHHQQGGQAPLFQNVIYHEIDFPSVTARKRNIVQSVPAVRSLLTRPVTEPDTDGDANDGGGSGTWLADLGRGNQLWGHGLDLRQIAAASAAPSAGTSTASATNSVHIPGLRTDVPTLLVSECCLCYLQPHDATAVLQWFASRIGGSGSNPSNLGVVVYEPIHPNDAFGRTMVANLAARGIEMPTLAAYPDGAAQEQRLRQEAGLVRATHRTVDAIWDGWVTEAEQERVNWLDGLDEIEEWQLLASHYVVAWGSRGAHFDAAWADVYGA